MKRILLLFLIAFTFNVNAQESSNLNFESFLFFKESGNKEQADKYAQSVIIDIEEGFEKKDTSDLELLLDLAAYYYSEDNLTRASDLYLKYTNYKRRLNPYLEKHFPSFMTDDEIFNNFIFFEGVLAGNQDIMKDILNKGFNINSTDINGLSAISYAAFRQDTNTLKFLIDKGINVDFEWKGSTSLHVTCEYGLYVPTRILLEAGANPFLLDLNNRTPRDYASANGFTKVVELLNPYFTGINNKKLNIQIGHKNPIKAMDISPNGELLATSEFRGNSFKLWDVKTKLQVKTVWIGEEITQVSFSSDNKYIFVATTFSSVYRYDLNERTVEKWLNHALIKQFGGVKVDDKYPIDVSDSHTVAAYTFKSFGDKNVEVLVFTTEGTITQKIFTSSRGFKYFKFDKTGNILAGVDDDGKLFLWDVKTAETIWEKELPGSFTLAGSVVLDFSPDNEILIVAGHGNNLISYNVSKGKEFWHLTEVDSASMDGKTKGDRKGLAYFRVQDLMCMAFIDDNTFVTSGADGTFRFWDLNKGKLLDVKYAGSYPAYQISPVPGTSTIIIAKDKYLIYLDYKSKNMKLFSESFINSANHVFFHQEKLITSNYKQVNTIDLGMGKLEEIYALPDTFQLIAEILPIKGKDEILVGLANPDRNLEIFYPVKGPDQKHIDNKHTYQKDAPDTLIIDGKEVISGIMSTLGRYDKMNHVVYYNPVDSVNEGGTAMVMSYNYKNKEIEWFDDVEDVNYISSFALSPENKYFAFLKNGAEVNLYNIEENQKFLLWNRYRLNEIDFLDNSPSIVNLEDEEVTLSLVSEIKKDYYEESEILYFLHLGKANMGDMAVSPKRNYIAFSRYETSSESVIQVWDVKAGKEKHLECGWC
jgi:WD40 repeat protein